MVTDEKPSLPAAIAGTMSALIIASTAWSDNVARRGVGRPAEAEVRHLDVEPARLPGIELLTQVDCRLHRRDHA